MARHCLNDTSTHTILSQCISPRVAPAFTQQLCRAVKIVCSVSCRAESLAGKSRTQILLLQRPLRGMIHDEGVKKEIIASNRANDSTRCRTHVYVRFAHTHTFLRVHTRASAGLITWTVHTAVHRACRTLPRLVCVKWAKTKLSCPRRCDCWT